MLAFFGSDPHLKHNLNPTVPNCLVAQVSPDDFETQLIELMDQSMPDASDELPTDGVRRQACKDFT